MAEQERYGLSAVFEFDDNGAIAKMRQVSTVLTQLQRQLQGFQRQQSQTVGAIAQLAGQAQSVNRQAANAISQFNRPAQQTQSQLQGIAKQFRAIRAEARNIDFGDLHDAQAFESGRQSISRYIGELKALEKQISGVSAEERILIADLKRQQRILADYEVTVGNQRNAAIAKQEMGLPGIAKQLRAIRAEARNIDFGDLHDAQAFESGRQSISRYIGELKALEKQISGVSAEERILIADLKRQQRILGDREAIAGSQRKAAIAQEGMGMAGTVAAVGIGVIASLKAPLESAREYSKELGGIVKLAGDVDTNRLSRDVMALSGRYGTLRSAVSSAYEELAASGADFSDLSAINKRVDAILQVSTALDVSVDKSTALQKQLALTYGKDVGKMGGIDVATMRVGSAVNVLADQLENASVSGEGVLARIPPLLQTIGNKTNFPIQKMAALSSVFETMNIDPSTGSAFIGRLFTQMGAKTEKFASSLGMSVADFKATFENDATTAIQSVTKQLASIDSDLDKRTFLKGLGIGNAEDQAAMLGLANNSEMLASAITLANKAFAENTSIAKENANVQQQSKFQFDRMATGFANLRTQIGLALDTSLLPLYKIFGSVLDRLVAFNSEHPRLVQAIVTVTAVIAGVAAVAGTAGLAVFWLQSAMATAAVGMTTMASAGIPLTGFFATIMKAFAGQGIVAGVTSLGGAIGGVIPAITALATGPIGIAIGTVALLGTVIQAMMPTLNVLGVGLGAIAAVFGVVAGAIKGLIGGFVGAFSPLISDVKALLAALFPASEGVGYITKALQMAGAAFQRFFGIGEGVGGAIGAVLGTAVVLPLRAIIGLVRLVAGAFALLGKVGAMAFNAIRAPIDLLIVGPLSFLWHQIGGIANAFKWAADWITGAWQKFVDFFGNMPLVSTALSIADKLINALNHNPTERIPEAWEKARIRITDSINWLLMPAKAIAHSLSIILGAPAKLWAGAVNMGASWFDGLIGAGQSAAGQVQSAWMAARDWFAGLSLPTPQMAIAPLGNVINWVRDRWTGLINWMGAGLGRMSDGFAATMQLIADGWGQFVGWFLQMPLVSGAWQMAQSIGQLLTQPAEWFGESWRWAADRFAAIFGGIQGMASAVGGAIATILDPSRLIGGLIDGALSMLRGVINAIRNSGLGQMLGGQLDRFDNFLGESQQSPRNSLAIAGASQPPTPPQMAMPAFPVFKLPELPPLELPTIDLSAAQQQMQFAGREMGLALSDSFSDSARLLRSGDSAGAVFEFDAQRGEVALSQLGSAVAVFAGDAVQSLSQLDFDGLTRSAQIFGASLGPVAATGASALGGLALAALGFGAAALATLSPVVLIIGGLALGAAAIATNFLGIRTILGGIAKVIQGAIAVGQGLFEVLAAIIRVMGNTGRAIGQILGGIPAALRGDFAQIGAGWRSLIEGMQAAAVSLRMALDRVMGGIGLSIEGVGQIGRGVSEGVQQAINGTLAIARGSVAAIKAIAQGVSTAFGVVMALPDRVRSATNALGQQWDAAQSAIASNPLRFGLGILKSIRSTIKAIGERMVAGWRSAIQMIQQWIPSVDLSRVEALPTIISGVGDRVVGLWRSTVAAVGGLPFVPDAAGLERIKAIAGSVADGVGATWRSVVSLIGGLPLVADGSALERLRGLTTSITDTISGAWRSVTGLVASLPLMPDASRLESIKVAVLGTGDAIQSAWKQTVGFVSELPLAATWGSLRQLPDQLGAIAANIKTLWRGAVDFVSGLGLRGDVSGLMDLPDRVGTVMAGIKQSVMSTAEGLAAPFIAAADKIAALWQGLTDKITAPLSGLVEKSKGFGMGLIRNLSENSPGPTFQIRVKWASTLEQIGGGLAQLTDRAKVTGQQIAGQLGDKLSGKLGKVSGGFTQAGVLLSNFAPGLAAPLFAMNDILDSAGMLSDNLPALQKGLGQVGASAAKLPGLLGGLGSTLLSLAGPVSAAIGSSLVPILGMVATAAGAAWAAVIAPALPFIGVAAAIVGAVMLVKKAFDTNFLGIRDLVTGVFKAIGAVGSWLLTPFLAIGDAIQGAIALITSGWERVKGVVSGVLGFLPGLAMQTGKGLVNALNHNPTVKIPIAWEGAQSQVAGSIQSMVPIAESTGTQLATSLSTQPIVQPVIAEPIAVGEAPTLPGPVQEQSQSTAVGGASFLSPIAAGVAGVTSRFDQMKSAASQAIGSINVETATGAIASLRDTVGGAIKAATDGIRNMASGFMQLAIAALPSLLPVGLVLGGIALAAAALATNFLGIRTITAAVFDGVRGAISGMGQAFSGVIQITQGAINTLRGIGAALSGDWSLVQVGLSQIRSGFQYVFGGLGAIVRSGVDMARGVLIGFGQAAQQVWSVVKRFLGPAGEWIDDIFSQVGLTIRGVMAQVETLAGKLSGVGQAIANSPLGRTFGGGKAQPASIPQAASSPVSPIRTELTGLAALDQKLDATTAKANQLQSGIGRAQGAIGNVGMIAGAVAPQLSGPIGALCGIFDGVIGLIGLLPGLSALFTGLITGTVTVGGLMASAFAGIATAAGAAWMAITGPLLPIVGLIALVGGAIWAISQNVFGFGDAFRMAWRLTIEPFWTAIREATSTARAAMMNFGSTLSGVFGMQAMGPVSLFGKLLVGVFTVVLLPIRVLSVVLDGVIKLVAGLAAAAINAVAVIVRIVFWPISAVLSGVNLLRRTVFGAMDGLAIALTRPIAMIGSIVGFVGGVIKAIASSVIAVGSGLWSVLSAVGGALTGVLGGILSGPLMLIQSAFGAIGRLIGAVGGMASVVGGAFSAVSGAIAGAFTMLWSLIPAPLRWLLEQAANGVGWLVSAVTGGGGTPQGTVEPQRFAIGGYVEGPGGPTADKIPSLLSAGEFVVNAAATAMNLPMLAALNAGQAIAPMMSALPMPLPVPLPLPIQLPIPAVSPTMTLGGSKKEPPEIHVHINVTINGMPEEVAESLGDRVLNELAYSEQFQRGLRDQLRDLVEFSK